MWKWNFSNFPFLSVILYFEILVLIVDGLPQSHQQQPFFTNIDKEGMAAIHRGAEVQEYLMDKATEKVLEPALPSIKDAVAHRISTYTVFIHEDHVENLLWAIPQLKFTAISYKAEAIPGMGMKYYVRYKVGYQCFQVKLFTNLDGDEIKVEDVIGAIDCHFPIIFF